MHKTVGSFLTTFGVWTASPWAFAVFLLFGITWVLFERETLDWHGAATLATWLMTLCIQRAEHRDTQAIHAKLDELLRTQGGAARLDRIDEAEPEEIEKRRDAAKRDPDGRAG
jgi:low affinity Fe/Cu permease